MDCLLFSGKVRLGLSVSSERFGWQLFTLGWRQLVHQPFLLSKNLRWYLRKKFEPLLRFKWYETFMFNDASVKFWLARTDDCELEVKLQSSFTWSRAENVLDQDLGLFKS
jgi:hypothetical protein